LCETNSMRDRRVAKRSGELHNDPLLESLSEQK
jgi:hypothetical protein